MIAIIKGCGTNIASIQFALERLGVQSILTNNREMIQAASHVILPGVNIAANAMSELNSQDMVDFIRDLKQPVLGICLGMQLLYEYSSEGDVDCLGIISGKVTILPQDRNLALPHMGWNQLDITAGSDPLFNGIKNGSYVYFVHSYAAPVNDATIATTKYGESFTAVTAKNNFYGVQFHPERSGTVGEKLLKNFIEIQ